MNGKTWSGLGCAVSKALLCGALLAALVAGMPACRSANIPMTDIAVPFPDIPIPKIPLPKIPLLSRGDADYRDKEWLIAFEETHARMAREYPFTEWKGVDWPALYETYAARVEAAAKAKDKTAYYLALREYIYSIPDGHMRIEERGDARDAAIGGGYGFAAIELEDGTAIAAALDEDGPAAQAGMQWGAQLEQWNGAPAAEAIGAVSTLWAEMPPATAEGKRIQQCRLLTRGPVGQEAEVTFLNPGADAPTAAKLTAEDDGYAMFDALLWRDTGPSEYESPFDFDTLAGGYRLRAHLFRRPHAGVPLPADHLQNVLYPVYQERCARHNYRRARQQRRRGRSRSGLFRQSLQRARVLPGCRRA